MADNVTLNSMSGGAVVATDDTGTAHVQIVKLAISADGSATFIPADAANGIDVDVTRVSGTVTVIERGATVGHSTASVTTSAASILASSSTRRTATFQNLGTDFVWLGASGITANNGLRLAPGQTAVIDRSPNAQVFAIASSGTQTVSIFTESD